MCIWICIYIHIYVYIYIYIRIRTYNICMMNTHVFKRTIVGVGARATPFEHAGRRGESATNLFKTCKYVIRLNIVESQKI